MSPIEEAIAILTAKVEGEAWSPKIAKAVPALRKALSDAAAEQRDIWEEAHWCGIEFCIKLIEGGHFLHDQAPTRRFANEVVAMLRREREAISKAGTEEPK